MLWWLAACAFVEPEVDLPDPGPSPEVRAQVDDRRDALLLTDGGVELWRAADAHGTWLRWQMLGPPTVHTEAGPLAADDPRLAYLFAPYGWLEGPAPSLSYSPSPVLSGAGWVATLDVASRRVVQIDDAAGAWHLRDHRDIDRMVLPHELVGPGGETLQVTRYAWP